MNRARASGPLAIDSLSFLGQGYSLLELGLSTLGYEYVDAIQSRTLAWTDRFLYVDLVIPELTP